MARSLVDLLTKHASHQPDRTAYRYLVTGDRDGEIQDISYGRLAERSRAVASWLQERGLAGSRAMLLYPPGLEFICGYLGCLSAGVVAVPGVPPQGRSQNHRALTRMKRLIADADAKVILGGREVIAALGTMAEHLPELAEITCVATEDIPDAAAGSWREPDLTADSVAFLQYTSGSTSAPRGVMVTHGNLLDNERVITERMGHTPDTIAEYDHELFVSWLPVYHDMGLIGPVLNTVYLGATATLFSPLHFLQQPQRWLTALSHYRPHTSGGPNFAYELCLKQATPDLLDGLDLSRWKVAFNGAEPVRAATLRRFTETFGTAGFRREALYPCYGLAEATLMVTGGSVAAPPTLIEAPETGPHAGAADAAAVGSGRPGPGVTLVIADPERQQELPDGEVGEIWVLGASVAKGYWRNTLATRESFRATLKNREGRFLRTGDLGFLRDGELFVTGRLKDLIVIDGRNHYPQDLELSAEMSHPALRPGCTATFSVDGGVEGEQPVIVAEAAPEAADEFEKITDRIRSAIGEAHGLSVRDVVLVHPGTIPKTSSGKIQRRASRTAYLDGTLSVVGAAATR
ncbi:peptide synthetase [Streptomyces avermitilis]|uniref:Non-ribosomal peptide synthetase n=2 Tax=Streptomyces avermitilis TaxID=33903 RepID=Q79ZI5_STRAW|nr:MULTISPECIES: fatty acyl-AMP ligase [Streptomyces]KUN55037.1 peptide synthetase [Streptomyces avermitilis]MYS97179.1 AMP-binding protein [Streptomyces sp. SID5469]OOV24549.1 peptide synthetase [Streptomyces avermitilis]BAB69218.1 non-ribosomal peptide synthetase [Streptomyces avermitilis]BAC69263.1 putative non-ribosomal peptide synthetase [Streptomyces avermitilis MA-4680 = NBRC 14893]